MKSIRISARDNGGKSKTRYPNDKYKMITGNVEVFMHTHSRRSHRIAYASMVLLYCYRYCSWHITSLPVCLPACRLIKMKWHVFSFAVAVILCVRCNHGSLEFSTQFFCCCILFSALFLFETRLNKIDFRCVCVSFKLIKWNRIILCKRFIFCCCTVLFIVSCFLLLSLPLFI